MKLHIRLLLFVVFVIAEACTTPQKGVAQEASVNFQLFYDQLSPYGTWVDYQNYGYVWIPDVDRDFSPYGSDGHWIFTDDGWTWVSDYSWGWAPFHYGRWAYDDSYGWLWVPHNEWGPAWVTWRRSAGYYGWAPMGPGISVEFSFGESYRVPDNHWRFVHDRDFGTSDIDRHYVERSTNVTIINQSTVINNTYIDNSRHTTYVAGPKRDEVQVVTGTTIRPVTIQENDKPGQALNNDQLRIFRPHVQTNIPNQQKPVPTNVVKLAQVTPVAERKPASQRQNDHLAPDPKDQPSQPKNPAAIDKKAASDLPPVTPPHDEKKSMQEKPVATETRNEPAAKQPVPPIPEEGKKNTQHQSPPPNPDVKGKSSAGEPPVVTDPYNKNRNPEHQAPPTNANKQGTTSSGEVPAPVKPNEKHNGAQPQSQPPNVYAPPNKQAGEPPPVSHPNDKNKGAGHPPTTKGKPAKSPPAKIQGEDNKAPKSDKSKQDSTSNHSQIQLRQS